MSLWNIAEAAIFAVHRGAPDAFRMRLRADADWLTHWAWDLGGPLLKHGQTVCDLGNLKTRPKDGPGNRALIESTTRGILEAGAAANVHTTLPVDASRQYARPSSAPT